MNASECRCAKCAKLCHGKPGWFSAGEATRAAAELGLSLPDFFKQHLARDYFVEDYDRDNDGDRSTRAFVLTPAWGGIEGKTVPYAHAVKRAACSLLGPDGCRLSATSRPCECRNAYGCRGPFNAKAHEVEQRQIVATFKADPGELNQLVSAGVLDVDDDGGAAERFETPFSRLLDSLGLGGP